MNQEKTHINVRIDHDLKRQLQHLLLEQDKSLTILVEELIKEYLARHATK
jgi:predicted transcriptional regulator